MFVILVTISVFVLTNALTPVSDVELGDDKIKQVLSSYISNVPDIEEQFVIDERLSRAIAHYFKGKISSFPLYKVSVKIDRTPVKIPWTLGNPNTKVIKVPPVPKKQSKAVKKRYKYDKVTKKKNAKKPTKNVTTTTITPITTISSIINTTL